MSNPSQACRVPLAAAFLLALLCASCTKTLFYHSSPYRPGQPATSEPLPIAGLWSIKLADAHGKLHTIASDRILCEGTPAGFETAPDGTLYALAGDDRFPIHNPPTGTLFWFNRQKVPSHLSRELDKALVASEPLLSFVTTSAITAGECYLDDISIDIHNKRERHSSPRTHNESNSHHSAPTTRPAK